MFATEQEQTHPGYIPLDAQRYSAGERWQVSAHVTRQLAGERGVETLSCSQILARQRLMKLALMIEPDARRLSEWWSQTPIDEFGSRTANELVEQGLENLVEKFLLAIVFGDRG
jgi:hypothetical protein